MKTFLDTAPIRRRLLVFAPQRRRAPLRLLAAVASGPLIAASAWHSSSAGASTGRAAAPVVSGSGAPFAARWSWPVAAPHPVVRGYDQPTAVWSPGHRGIDIAAPDSAVVTSPDEGVVHFAGVVVDRPVLSIEHADGVVSSFEPVVATVEPGDVVGRGQVVGRVEPGHCPETTCFHLGARVDGRYVSPLLLLGAVQRAVLLPTRSLP